MRHSVLRPLSRAARLARALRRTAHGLLPALALSAACAHAAPFPSKPVTLVVSYPAGGSVDVAARILQEPLARALGQPVIIETRGGAGGTIGTHHVVRSAPDGHTLLITLSSHTINPAIYSKLPFDTEKDLAPVSLVASAPQILVAHPSFAPSTLPELLEYARQSRTEIPYGSAGTGSPSHIAGELLKQRTGLPFMHVAYRGGGPAVVDVLGGQIPLLWVSLPAVTQHVKEGRLKAIAVSTAERTPVLPEVPAAAETVPGFDVDSWYAVFAPAATPPEAIRKVQDALVAAGRDPAVQQAFLAQGAVAVGSTAQALDEVVRREIPQWKALAAQAGIQLD
ncbi:tripartite tricarboxylate transporter substrate binding protein [Orrella sp. JC864]|uniref:tripartite tricarboxylate transporter substrate binding protein n=1 Tax=Orrella sp. JC864 TaxID=3120298 RepID=UPI0012BD41E8